MNVGQHITFGDTCFALVQKYREGRRTKADTVQRLVHVVSDEKGRVSPGRHEQVSDAFIAYFKMLDDFDRERAAAAREGPPLDEDQRGAEDVPEEQDPAPAVSKHAREGDDDGGQAAKRPIDRDLIPFGKQNVDLPADLAKIRQLKQNYGRDPGFAKAQLLSSPDRPDFPTSFGETSSLIPLLTDEQGRKSCQHFGELQIVANSSKIERQIRSCGDWVVVTWNKYQWAVIFVYPNHEKELSNYGKHIEDSFLAIPSSPEHVLQ